MYQIKTLQSTQTPKQHKHRLTFSFADISAASQSTVYSKVTLRRAATAAETRRGETWRLSPLAEWGSHRWRWHYDSGVWPSSQPFMMCFLWFAACRAPWWLPCKSGQNATKKRSGGRQGPAVTFSPFLLLLAKLYYPYMSVNDQIYCQILFRLDDTVGKGVKISSLIKTNP